MALTIHNAENWALSMFGHARLGDKRRTKRLTDVTARQAKHSGNSVARACEGSGALLEGTYRFIRNDQVSADAIRRAGFEATAALANEREEVWVLEDTTSLSYKHSVAEKLGKLGKSTDKARGWWVHNDLMVCGKTTQTLGLVHQEYWCRPDNIDDADEKESGKWQAASESMRNVFGAQMSKVITVCDREADIFAYLQDKQRHHERYVVRARHMRQIEDAKQDLYSHLSAQQALGGYQVDIPQKGMVDKKGQRYNRKARTACLEVRAATVSFMQNNTPLTLNAVLAEEVRAPEGETPLRWLLLTSEPIDTLLDVLKVIRVYTTRWRVEDFHKAWKTGAGAERQRMVEPEHLERMVSILAFVAIRLMQLRESFTVAVTLRNQGLSELADKVEQMRCDAVLTKDEWLVLWQTDKSKRKPDLQGDAAPSLQWAYLAVARLGGFTDSKRTGIAGWATLWAGWEKLQERVAGFLTTKELIEAGMVKL